jgi:hypothetical protein
MTAMEKGIRESMEIWLTLASPQEIQDLMDMLLREIGRRSAAFDPMAIR